MARICIRIIFGGGITALAGCVGYVFGPSVGGLFRAFPVILPATLTLITNHEHKEAAGRDALGAVAIGLGLGAFVAVVWTLAHRLAPGLVLALAMLTWLVTSTLTRRFVRRFSRGTIEARAARVLLTPVRRSRMQPQTYGMGQTPWRRGIQLLHRQ